MLQQKLSEYGLYLLGRRQYGIAEFRKKLEQKVFKEQKRGDTTIESDTKMAIEEIIQKFISLKYLNDEEYLKNYVRSQLQHRPQGKKLLEARLLNKGLTSEFIKKFLDYNSLEEMKNAQKLMTKKSELLKNYPPQKRKEKLYRFLMAKGFSSDTIMETLRKS